MNINTAYTEGPLRWQKSRLSLSGPERSRGDVYLALFRSKSKSTNNYYSMEFTYRYVISNESDGRKFDLSWYVSKTNAYDGDRKVILRGHELVPPYYSHLDSEARSVFENLCNWCGDYDEKVFYKNTLNKLKRKETDE